MPPQCIQVYKLVQSDLCVISVEEDLCPLFLKIRAVEGQRQKQENMKLAPLRIHKHKRENIDIFQKKATNDCFPVLLNKVELGVG